MRRKILLFFLFMFAASLAVGNDETRDAQTGFFDQSFGNLKDEATTAKSENKRGVFIMFEQADCPFCAKMMSTVMNQVRVQDYYRKYFRTLQVDIRGDAAITDFGGRELPQKDFALQHRVRATPVFMFFDADGKELVKYTGTTRDADEFLWLAEFVVSGAYKTKNFTVYKRERDAGKH